MKKSGLFIIVALVLAASMVLSACQPQTVTQVETKEVPVEVQVEVPVQVTVEKIITPTPINYGDVVFMSTQFNTINEAEAVRGVVLKDFPATVDFIPSDAGTFFDRINAEVEAGKGTASVLGALAGEFSTLQATNSLQDLTSLKAEVADAGISDAFWNVASLGTDITYYVPWIQANYILAVNKQEIGRASCRERV